MEIEISKRAGRPYRCSITGELLHMIHAQVKDNPKIWGTGKTEYDAVGSLIVNNPNEFGLKIKDIGVSQR